jgi:hypothetical protein
VFESIQGDIKLEELKASFDAEQVDTYERLINLLCDRALLAAYSERVQRVAPEMVRKAAASLDLAAPRTSMLRWMSTRSATGHLALHQA